MCVLSVLSYTLLPAVIGIRFHSPGLPSFILSIGLAKSAGNAPMLEINRTTYDKSRLTIGTGYDRRPTHRKPESIIVHTTNGKRGTLFESEARYIYKSPAIGAHYLVGKSGQIIQFLEPGRYRAWHAGACFVEYNNARSIGIECHHAVGESWTVKQRSALTELVKLLMAQFSIPTTRIETHRRVALPAGRKVDPSDWSDRDFYVWRETLTAKTARYRVRTDTQIGVTVRAKPSAKAERVMAVSAGTLIEGRPVTGESVTLAGFGTSDQWLEITPDTYIWLPLLELVTS